MSTTTGPRDAGAHGAPPAPVGRRVLAVLLDGALTSLCAVPLAVAVLPAWLAAVRAGAGTGSDPATPPGPNPVLLVAGVLLLLAWGGVQWWCHGTRGWTVGRRVLGLRTVDVRSGRPIGLGRALVRSLVVAAGALACGVGQLLVLLSPLFDSGGRRRGWHDRVAEAVVVDVRGLVAARRVAAAPGPRTAPRPVPRPVPAPDVRPTPDALPDGGPSTRPAEQAALEPSAPGRAVLEPTDGEPTISAPTGPAPTGPVPTGLVPPARGSGWPPAGGVPHQVSPDPGLSPDLDWSPGTVPVGTEEPLVEPPAPTRTRWTTLAAGRQLDAPDLVLPALGRPGPGPDLDTRQLPAVGAVGAAGPSAPAPAPAPGAFTGGSIPSVAQETPVPRPHPGLPAPEPDPLPAWTPPPLPAPGSRRPDPLDLAVPWPAEPSAAPASAAEAPPAAPMPAPLSAVETPPAAPSTAGAPQADPLARPVVPPAPATFPAGASAPGLPVEAFPAPAPAGSAAGASAWTVRLPDGSVVGLDVPLLVGRNPAPVPGARPVAVADPGRSVSKTHLMLGVDEHGPWVVDRGSTNGTLVTLGDGQRIVCLADRRVRLTDGSLIAFGDLSLSVGVRA